MSIIGRTYLERGKPVAVLIQWTGKGPRNVLIERADGTQTVRPFRGLRKPSAGRGGAGKRRAGHSGMMPR